MLRPCSKTNGSPIPRLLVIGLDGAGLDLVDELIGRDALPNIKKLLAESAVSPSRSTVPATTLPAWTTFLTGASPSTHGVPDFTVRHGYRVRFVGGASRRCSTWLGHVEARGLTVGAAWFPATYPPERLAGYQISGWDSPVTAAGDRSFVYPPSLYDELCREFGDEILRFEAIDEFARGDDFYERAARRLPQSIRRKAEMASFLLRHRPVDVALFYFGETDTAAHHFWAFHDERSPRRPEHVPAERADVLFSVYRAVDNAVGELVRTVGPQTSVALVSDHGSAGASDWALHINNALCSAGLLAKRRRTVDARWLRGTATSLVPPSLRRSLFRLAGGLAPSWVESQVRFGDIDWSRTQAFSEELGYAPAVWFNQLGREPQGIVRASDRERVAARVTQCLLALRDEGGRRLVRHVVPRQELHRGPLAHLFPDLWIELEPLDGYTPVCLPSSTGKGLTVRRLAEDEKLGRKGRSMPGCHSPLGLFCLRAPSAAPGRFPAIDLQDAAPTLVSALGLPLASWFEGEPRFGLGGFRQGRTETNAETPPGSVYTPDEERVVANRLRRLGYLDE